jgi:hypothetical protein
MGISMIVVAQSIVRQSSRISGFAIVTVFSLVGIVLSAALAQHGVDLSTMSMG